MTQFFPTVTYEQRIMFAVADLKRIQESKTLLKGHFALVAKRHAVTVKDLKAAYGKEI